MVIRLTGTNEKEGIELLKLSMRTGLRRCLAQRNR